jgi:hypothetical protein
MGRLIVDVVNAYPSTLIYLEDRRDPIEVHCNEMVTVDKE